MKISISPRMLLLLLFAEVFLSLASAFLFLRLDGLVNSTLYEFGLQFNASWAQPYSLYSQLVLGLLLLITILGCISAAYVQIRGRAGLASQNWAFATITITVAVASGITAFSLTRLDLIVNSDMYNSGLQFSYVWAYSYWTYARFLLGLIGVVLSMNSFLALYFLSHGFSSFISVPDNLTSWNLRRLTTWPLAAAGIVSLLLSVLFESSTLAFVGLGLLFWGIVLLYVTPWEYARQDIAATMAIPSVTSLNQIIQNLGYKGKAFYLPPEYSEDFESNKIYIGRETDAVPPQPEKLKVGEKQVFIDNPEAAVLEAPGSGLSKLLEKAAGTRFTDVDVQFIQEEIGDLLVDELEVAKNFKMSIEGRNVHVLVEGVTYRDMNREIRNLSGLYGNVGCPISSAIACALAKAAGNLVTVEKELISEDGRTLEIEYNII